jgi:hypothetical protein
LIEGLRGTGRLKSFGIDSREELHVIESSISPGRGLEKRQEDLPAQS